MRWMIGAALAMTALFFAAGVVIARAWEAPSAEDVGLQLVFLTNYNSDSGKIDRVLIANLDGGNLQDLNVYSLVSCSPNGRYFVFADANGVNVASADGAEIRQVKTGLGGRGFPTLAVSNDGYVF